MKPSASSAQGSEPSNEAFHPVAWGMSARAAPYKGAAGRFLVEWALMFALLPPLLLWLHHQPGFGQLNTVLYDRLLQWHAPTRSPDVLIVAIDARSLRELGPWPWPRHVHAQLLERLAPHAPQSVLLDLFLDTPTSEDAQLAEAMKAVPVYLPQRLAEPERHSNAATTAMLAPPVPVLAAQARGTGHASVEPDADDMVRTLRAQQGPAGHAQPYVGLVMAERTWTAPRRGAFGIPFVGGAGSYPSVPYISVLRGEVPSELLQGRYILVGAAQDSGLGDDLLVSLGGRPTLLTGVEFHANAIDALRQGRAIRLPGERALWAWIALPVWLALMLFLRLPRHALAVTGLMLGLCLGISAVLLAGVHVWLPPVVPMAGLVLAYVLWGWRRLNALLGFLSRRIETLHAVPSGAFEPPPSAIGSFDTVDRQTLALDRAVDRLTHLQSLLGEGLWHVPAAVLLCRDDGEILQSNAAARRLLAPRELRVRGNASLLDAADLLAGVNLLHLLAAMPHATEADTGDAAEPPGPWSLAAGCEYTTLEGSVLRVRSAAIHSGASATAAIRVATLLDLTLERRAQRERAQWLGFLSHDMRSPQVTILNLLTLHAAPGVQRSVERLSHGIRREAERALALTESFVDLIEAESADYRFADIDAGAVVLDAVEQAAPMAELRGIALHPPGPSDRYAIIHADGALLQRALFNLISNAVRHSSPGSAVRVCLEVSEGDLVRPAQVVIAVNDEGAGMEAPQLAQLLAARHLTSSPPAAAHGDAAFVARRRGIGFTVVQAVVRRHGGWLDAHSAPGVGSTFLIGLPAAARGDS